MEKELDQEQESPQEPEAKADEAKADEAAPAEAPAEETPQPEAAAEEKAESETEQPEPAVEPKPAAEPKPGAEPKPAAAEASTDGEEPAEAPAQTAGEGPARTEDSERKAEETRPRRRGRGRRRICIMCADKMPSVDYKDTNFLRQFISDRGRIDSRRKSGNCAKHQRAIAGAIKRARHLALIPYTVEHIRASGVGPLR